MNQLHIFIFTLAVIHVLFSGLTIALGRAKVSARGNTFLSQIFFTLNSVSKSISLHALRRSFTENVLCKWLPCLDETLESMGKWDRNIRLSAFTWWVILIILSLSAFVQEWISLKIRNLSQLVKSSNCSSGVADWVTSLSSDIKRVRRSG